MHAVPARSTGRAALTVEVPGQRSVTADARHAEVLPQARNAARLDHAEAEARRALELRDYLRVQAIMCGLPADDAEVSQDVLGGG